MLDFTCIKHVRIIVGDGRDVIEDGVILFENCEDINDDHITFVGEYKDFDNAIEKEDYCSVFDLSGGKYTLLPGLINTHCHLDLELPYLPYYADKFGDSYRTLVMYRRAQEALLKGVTTVRGVGVVGECEVALKKAINNHMIWGPKIISCGSPLVPHAGHGSTVPGSILCSGEAEFMKGVRQNLAMDVDQIKMIYTGGLCGAYEGIDDVQMTEEEIKAVIKVAHNNSKPVTAHLSNNSAIKTAVECGLDGVEHGYTISPETAKLMAEKGTFYTPTLCVSHCNDYMVKLGVPEYTLKKQEAAAAEHIASAKRAYEAGVTICTGTDLLPSDPIGGTFATTRETELLVEELGMTPLEAIKCATLNGARCCRIDNITGTIEAGKKGDFIIVEGHPDEDIHDLRNVKLISRECRLVSSTLPQLNKCWVNVTAAGIPCDGGVFKIW